MDISGRFHPTNLVNRFFFSSFGVSVNNTTKKCYFVFVKFQFSKINNETCNRKSGENHRCELCIFILCLGSADNIIDIHGNSPIMEKISKCVSYRTLKYSWTVFPSERYTAHFVMSK